MNTLISKDGTKIAYKKFGEGPALIIVLGALNTGNTGASLAKLLSPHFTAVTYDRRGRGKSTDTHPYVPEREVEDLTALITEMNEPVYLYGHSSGAAIALEVTRQSPRLVKKLAIYEAPYTTQDVEIKATKSYVAKLKKLLSDGKDADAVALFISHVGVSENQIAALKRMPMWKGLVAIAPTLAYDSDSLGEGYKLPKSLLTHITTRTLVMHGGKGSASMAETAKSISQLIPKAELYTIEGQDHGVSPKVVSPVLAKFFK